MGKYIINKQETKTYQKVTRFLLIAAGVILFAFSDYFVEGIYVYLLKIFGSLLFIPAVINPFSIFGGKDQMMVTDDFIKRTEESIHFIEFLVKLFSDPKTSEKITTTRTAYWDEINKAILNRFSLRVFYSSGIGENFKIPYISKSEFEKLRSLVLQKSEEHNFHVQEERGWQIF